MGAFDDLEEVQEQEQDDSPPDDASASEMQSETEDGKTARVTDDQGTNDGDSSAASQSSDLSEEAFEFSETTQKAVYPLPETWAEFEDMLDLELERELREQGIREVSKSEKHNAVLEVIQNHPEEVADAIKRARADEE